MDNTDLELIRKMNEYIKAKESERMERKNINERWEKLKVNKHNNFDEQKVYGITESEDFLFNVNALYAQLMKIHSSVFLAVKNGKKVSQEDWEKMSEELINAYNFAAGDSGYYLQWNKK